MKKTYILIFFLLISCCVYSQQPKWIVFKAPQPPFIKTEQEDHISSIALNASKNKLIKSSTDLTKFNLPNLFGNNSLGSKTLPDNFIVCMAIDKIGNIWIGTNSGGLAKFDGINWIAYNNTNSRLPSNTIFSLAIDKNGKKWIGTTKGLVKFDGTRWKIYNTKNSRLPSNIIYSLAIDKNGDKWIGTTAGLVKFDEKKWKVYNTSNSKLPDNYITAITIDETGNKWIGTYEGLVKFNGSIWKVFNTSNSGLPFNDIYSISNEGDNKMLAGTWGGGLARYNNKKWTAYRTSRSGLPDDNVSSIAIDSKGNKWIGTLNGLVKFSGRRWTIYNVSNSSLPDNMVYSLVNDNCGNLWIGTHNGLAIFNEEGIVPLPADVSTFYSKAVGNNITLAWKSEHGTDNYGFEIEKKVNNSDWEKIGFVGGEENINSSNEYSFLDRHSVSGKIFYRLKQIDNTGKYKCSNIIEEFVGIPSSFSLEQNLLEQGTSTTKIKFGLPVKAFTKLIIYNAMGSEVETLVSSALAAGYYEAGFKTVGLPHGIYYYKITADKFIGIKKLVL